MIGYIIAKSLILIVALLSLFAGLMLMERKVLGFFHLRHGPNRTGPWGLAQPIADAVKMIIKEDIIPADADRPVYVFAPILSLTLALAAYAAIPIGPPITIGGQEITLSIFDPGVGVLALLAVTGLSVYGVTLGGWASQGKYALLGSIRATAQMISYELSMVMSLVGVVIIAGSVRFFDIVAAQENLWMIVMQPVGFVLFLISAFAETSRAPFDLPEAETELISGYSTEYTGMRWAMFVMSEYIHMVTASSMITLLYLGGWNGPFLPPVVWFLLKTGVLLFFFMWVRATLPRLRYDRLMNFGWKVMLPLSIVNLIVTAVAVALFG